MFILACLAVNKLITDKLQNISYLTVEHTWYVVVCHLKDQQEMIIITSTVKAYVHWNHGWFSGSINRFGDNEVIFQYDNVPCYRAKKIKVSLWENHLKSVT